MAMLIVLVGHIRVDANAVPDSILTMLVMSRPRFDYRRVNRHRLGVEIFLHRCRRSQQLRRAWKFADGQVVVPFGREGEAAEVFRRLRVGGGRARTCGRCSLDFGSVSGSLALDCCRCRAGDTRRFFLHHRRARQLILLGCEAARSIFRRAGRSLFLLSFRSRRMTVRVGSWFGGFPLRGFRDFVDFLRPLDVLDGRAEVFIVLLIVRHVHRPVLLQMPFDVLQVGDFVL